MLRLASVSAALACVAGAALAQPPAPAKVLDPKHIPPGFALAVTTDPNRLQKAAASVGLPADEWRKQIRAGTGVDPADLERVTLLHEPLLNWSVLGMGAVALQYPKTADRNVKLAAVLGGEPQKATVGGHTYFKSKKYAFLDDLEVAGCVDADGRVLVSVWPVLEFMLGIDWDDKRRPKHPVARLSRDFAFGNMTPPTGKPTALGLALNAADLDHDLVLVFTPQPLLDKFDKLKDPPEIPAEYREAVTALKRVTTVVATVDLAAEPFLRVEFRAPDADGGKAVLDGLTALLKAAKPAWPGVRDDLLMGIDADLRNLLLATADEVVNAPKLSRDGAVVTLAVGRPKGIGPKK